MTTSTSKTSKVQPFNAKNHPHATRYAFSAEATVSGVRLLTIMSCSSHELYNTRSIATMAGLSPSTVSVELRRLQQLGYIVQTDRAGWRLAVCEVRDDEDPGDRYTDQSDRQTDQNDPKRSADRSLLIATPITPDRQTDHRTLYNILNNNINNNIYNTSSNTTSSEVVEKENSFEVVNSNINSEGQEGELVVKPIESIPPSKKGSGKRAGRLFEPRESITVQQYQQMLLEPSLANGDKEWLKECILEMRDWSHSNQKKKVDWAAALRNWIRRAKRERRPAKRPITFVESEQMRVEKVWENAGPIVDERELSVQEQVQKILAEQKELDKRRTVY